MTCPCMLIWLKEACGLVVGLMKLHAFWHGIALHRMSMHFFPTVGVTVLV